MYINVLLRLLKVGALGCAVVLTTFSNCQAMEYKDTENTNNIKISRDIPSLSSADYLELAKRDILAFETLLDNSITSPEDNCSIIKDSNESLHDVNETIHNFIKTVVHHALISSIEVRRQMFQCIETLKKTWDKLATLCGNDVKKIPVLHEKAMALERAMSLCEDFSYHLRHYRDELAKNN